MAEQFGFLYRVVPKTRSVQQRETPGLEKFLKLDFQVTGQARDANEQIIGPWIGFVPGNRGGQRGRTGD
jgi:hypothetical protein